jgi:hypothetical protein
MQQQQQNPCGCINREPLKPPRKRRFSGCDMHEIDASVVKTWFKLGASAADTQQLLVNSACVRIELMRKGSEDVFASYDAFSTNTASEVSFYWDAEFLERPFGFYIGDIFINEHYCFSVQFRIRKCEAVALSCRNEVENACLPGCTDTIGASGMPITCVDEPCITQDALEAPAPQLPSCGELPSADCASPAGCAGGIGAVTIGPNDIGTDDE